MYTTRYCTLHAARILLGDVGVVLRHGHDEGDDEQGDHGGEDG